jgi:segregation and condensation protein B
MSEQENIQTKSELAMIVEALLFVAAGPVSIAQLAEALETKPEEIEASIQQLHQSLLQNHGLQIQWNHGKVQLTTRPELSSFIEKFLGLEATAKLSRAALETLAIIAYRQPITRPGVDAIRGVNSDGVMRSLLSKGLVEDVGRAEGPGRPILYGTSSEFLQHFGLASLDEMPDYDTAQVEHAEQISLLKD